MQQAIYSAGLDERDEAERSVKEHCHARISGVSLQAFKNVTLPRSSDMGSLVAISGTVIRTGGLKLIEKQKDLRCTKCKQHFTIYVDFEQERTPFIRPSQCPHKCGGASFVEVENSSIMANYQEIKVQEQIQGLTMGSIPRSVLVVLMDDLVDTCQAGDDITIVGIPLRKWGNLHPDQRCPVGTFVMANHLQVHNEREFNVHITEELTSEFTQFWEQFTACPLRGRDTILQSVCPQVFGMYFVKLSFLLVLIGGRTQQKSGLRIRGESHLLLVGEPGTGKSQFLKYGVKLGQRSVMTTGTGSTSAGLTVTAVKDKGGEWVLEAGALVLADGGVCCIDEFNCIQTGDRAAIHEAMEQQTLSVAKAGLVCKLNSRTTVIAACNPKGPMDASADLSINLGIASPLLSRFDLVLLLNDDKDSCWDEQVSSFILSGIMEEEESVWTIDQLKSYIAFVKATITPILSPEAQKVLSTYYQMQRGHDGRNQARTTIRLLESMIRLTEAHARLMFRSTATVVDAVYTITLVECSLRCSALAGVPSALHSYFPEDPDAWYQAQESRILERLRLSHLATTGSRPPSPPPVPKQEPKEETFDSPYRPSQHSQYSQQQRAQTRSSRVPRSRGISPPQAAPPSSAATNIWSVFSQREPEVAGEAVSHIGEDRTPIDDSTAMGLERRLAERFEERRANREKENQQRRQGTIDWDNYDFTATDDVESSTADLEYEQSSECAPIDEEEAQDIIESSPPPPEMTGRKRILQDEESEEERRGSLSPKRQRLIPEISEEESENELGQNGLVEVQTAPPSREVNTGDPQASQGGVSLAALRLFKPPAGGNRRKKFVD